MLAKEFFTVETKVYSTFDAEDFYTCKLCGLTLRCQCAGSLNRYEKSFEERAQDRLEDHIMKYHRDELKKAINNVS